MTRLIVNPLRSDDAGGRRRAPVGHPGPLAFHRSLPGYRPSPLVEVPSLARRLGVASLLVKDESSRFGLPAFKILGASWAVNIAVARRLGLAPAASFSELRERAAALGAVTLTTATDGNHGRAAAHMAALLGWPARIYVPAGTAQARMDAIVGEGARLVVVEGSYDDAVARSAADADERSLLVSDTSWAGYEAVPRAVIDGYSTILLEIERQLVESGAPRPDLVFVQAGVGALAAAVAAHFHAGTEAPAAVMSVEPEDAACVLESLAAGHIVTVAGPHRSIMAGLNCGTPSLVAWHTLMTCIDAAMTVDDDLARRAMLLLADSGIASGESGAAGLAGLIALLETPGLGEARSRLRVGRASRVLVFSTEGPTDPQAYQRLLGGAER
jgi:diaminopropionate ammonia-lyase